MASIQWKVKTESGPKTYAGGSSTGAHTREIWHTKNAASCAVTAPGRMQEGGSQMKMNLKKKAATACDLGDHHARKLKPSTAGVFEDGHKAGQVSGSLKLGAKEKSNPQKRIS